jgi:hypothetical protein
MGAGIWCVIVIFLIKKIGKFGAKKSKGKKGFTKK